MAAREGRERGRHRTCQVYTQWMPNALVNALGNGSLALSVELRPPRAELDAAAGMDAWIDTYHAVRGLVAERDVRVSDRQRRRRARRTQPSAPRHQSRYGRAARSRRAVPHDEALARVLPRVRRAGLARRLPLARRPGRRSHGRPAPMRRARVAAARSDPRARAGSDAGRLGESACGCGQTSGLPWRPSLQRRVLPHAGHLAPRPRRQVDRFLDEAHRQRLAMPGIFGVFYYRSANPKTLAMLKQFLPVPVDGLRVEFGEGASAEEVCARTIRGLRAQGVRHFYVSNLPIGRARQTLEKIVGLAGLKAVRSHVPSNTNSSANGLPRPRLAFGSAVRFDRQALRIAGVADGHDDGGLERAGHRAGFAGASRDRSPPSAGWTSPSPWPEASGNRPPDRRRTTRPVVSSARCHRSACPARPRARGPVPRRPTRDSSESSDDSSAANASGDRSAGRRNEAPRLLVARGWRPACGLEQPQELGAGDVPGRVKRARAPTALRSDRGSRDRCAQSSDANRWLNPIINCVVAQRDRHGANARPQSSIAIQKILNAV